MLLIPNRTDFELDGKKYTFWSEKPMHLSLYKCVGLYCGLGIGAHNRPDIENVRLKLEGLIEEKREEQERPNRSPNTELDSEISEIKAKVGLYDSFKNSNMPDEIAHPLVNALVNLVQHYVFFGYGQEAAVADVTDFVLKSHRLKNHKPYHDTDKNSEYMDVFTLAIYALGYRPYRLSDFVPDLK